VSIDIETRVLARVTAEEAGNSYLVDQIQAGSDRATRLVLLCDAHPGDYEWDFTLNRWASVEQYTNGEQFYEVRTWASPEEATDSFFSDGFNGLHPRFVYDLDTGLKYTINIICTTSPPL